MRLIPLAPYPREGVKGFTFLKSARKPAKVLFLFVTPARRGMTKRKRPPSFSHGHNGWSPKEPSKRAPPMTRAQAGKWDPKAYPLRSDLTAPPLSGVPCPFLPRSPFGDKQG